MLHLEGLVAFGDPRDGVVRGLAYPRIHVVGTAGSKDEVALTLDVDLYRAAVERAEVLVNDGQRRLGGISKRSRGCAPGSGWRRRRTRASSPAAADPARLPAVGRGGVASRESVAGEFSCPAGNSSVLSVTAFLGPVPCVAPRLRAYVMIIANTISSLVNSGEGSRYPDPAGVVPGGRTELLVTKRLLLKVNPR